MLNVVAQAIKMIQATTLNHRVFKELCKEDRPEYIVPLLHAEVR
jgi:hypothetical protein